MMVMISLTSLADGFHTPHTNLVTGLITFHGNGQDGDYEGDDDYNENDNDDADDDDCVYPTAIAFDRPNQHHRQLMVREDLMDLKYRDVFGVGFNAWGSRDTLAASPIPPTIFFAL